MEIKLGYNLLLSLVIISKPFKCTALATLLTEDFICPLFLIIESILFQDLVCADDDTKRSSLMDKILMKKILFEGQVFFYYCLLYLVMLLSP